MGLQRGDHLCGGLSDMAMTPEIAQSFARIALGHVGQEYPNKLDHVMGKDADARSPRALHPVFFGSFDWHSCVHSWWMLLVLRRRFPQMPEAKAIAELASTTFTAENLAVELEYLNRPESRGFERPYGWGWLLFLHLEAAEHSESEWSTGLEPLARVFADRFKEYLGKLSYPITVGTHFNTAFALRLSLDWAEKFDPELADCITAYARRVFIDRSNYSGWEPGGDEFLSPVLSAAHLMVQLLPNTEFEPWFTALVLANGWVEQKCLPVTVSDRSDGKIAHLDGLNLSRAWSLAAISRKIGEPSAKQLLAERAQLHLDASMPHVAGDYMGEHWLASFATLALLEME